MLAQSVNLVSVPEWAVYAKVADLERYIYSELVASDVLLQFSAVTTRQGEG